MASFCLQGRIPTLQVLSCPVPSSPMSYHPPPRPISCLQISVSCSLVYPRALRHYLIITQWLQLLWFVRSRLLSHCPSPIITLPGLSSTIPVFVSAIFLPPKYPILSNRHASVFSPQLSPPQCFHLPPPSAGAGYLFRAPGHFRCLGLS